MTAEAKRVRAFAQADERHLQKLRDMAPSYPIRLSRQIIWRFSNADGRFLFLPWADLLGFPCAYCGRRSKRQQLAVNPIMLQRKFFGLCRRRKCSQLLRDWEGEADARRRRAQYDWERENPTVAPLMLVGEIPPQYPSISRATLRAFLDSGYDVATLTNSTKWSVPALNGSIRRLGFAAQVFAEIRSGQAVLRRVPEMAS